MATSDQKRKKYKRNLNSSSHETDSKKQRIPHPDNKQQPPGVWDNLDLILSLHNKQLTLQRKVELAFDFINSTKHSNKQVDDQSRQTVSFSRLVTFLIDWIQSTLISSNQQEACLDVRCWEIFKFSIQECLSLQIPLSISSNILRALSCIARNAASVEGVESYSVVCDCVGLLFTHRGRLFNANVDLWVSLAVGVVDLVRGVCSVVGGNVGASVIRLRFSSLVLEHFDSFLRVHPSPKNVFPVFVDRLLEPLLSLLTELYLQSDGDGLIWKGKLLKMVEDILCNGLFHSAHIDGFLTAHSVEKSVESNDGRFKNSRPALKSYHRHFFLKLEKIMAEKGLAVGGIGRLFGLFVVRVKKQKGVADLSDRENNASTANMVQVSYGHNNVVSENAPASRLDSDTSKSLFGLFVRFLEPLMLNIKEFSEDTLEREQSLFVTLSFIKSIKYILASFAQEKVYARTEDGSEGVCLNFLKDIFQTIISFCTKIHSVWLSSKNTDDCKLIDMMPLLAKEILDSLGYFLEIEYEVIENDLVNLWLVIFMYSAVDLSLTNTPEKCLLVSSMMHLGSRLINIYSELRQVHKPIFALCKAVRLFGFHNEDNEINYSRFRSCKLSLSFELRVQSVTMLICSQDFRLAMSNAIKFIPEGQVSGCIGQLKMDISESLEWVKDGYSMDRVHNNLKSPLQSRSMCTLHEQVHLFGRVLSEIYTLILDNSAVATGNCILVGNAMKDLMTLIKSNLSTLVGNQTDSVDGFLYSILGIQSFIQKMPTWNSPTPEPISVWIFLFFFRVYMSCRSLFRQLISLMPPNSSKKTSREMGDLLTAYSGNDCLEGTGRTTGDYFSWIIEPSASLMNVIQSVCGACPRDNTEDCAQLTYILHAMAIQRLIDLNRQIKTFEFLHEKVVRLAGIKLTSDDGSDPCRKERNFFAKRISVLVQEARDITSFLMRYLPIIKKQIQSSITENYVKFGMEEAQNTQDAWDLGVCSLTEKSLPTAIWWILCQNTDIWCTHATKKQLRKFVSCLLQNASSCVSCSADVGNQKMSGLNNLRIVTMRQISLVLLSDTIFHEESILCRHLSSRFCQVLKNSALPLFSDSLARDADLNSLPNWPEVLSKLEQMPDVFNNAPEKNVGGPNSLPFKLFSMEDRKQLAICQNLLNLLSWMPKGHIDTKSFSCYATHILNLERLVVLSLLHHRSGSCMQKQNDLFRLFVHCRRALKCLVMAYCENKIESGQSLLLPVLCESSFSVLWLSKSVSAVVQLSLRSGESSIQVKQVIFSLMDHTSYLFLTLTKIQSRIAVSALFNKEVPQTELPFSVDPSSQNDPNGPHPSVEASKICNVWKDIVLMAETLKEQTKNLLLFVKTKQPIAEGGVCFSVVDFNRFSSLISCFQGFLWGLASAMSTINLSYVEERKPFRWKLPRTLVLYIDEFEDFIHLCLHAVIAEEGTLPLPDCIEDSSSSEIHMPGAGFEHLAGQEQNNISRGKDDLADSVRSSKNWRKVSRTIEAETTFNSLNDFDSFGKQQLKIPLLQSLLRGGKPELAFLIRELLTASSAILTVKANIKELKAGFCKSSSGSMPIFIWTSQFLLSKFGDIAEELNQFSYVWLDGVVKYIEALGSYISFVDSPSSKNAYTRLINMHLGAIGKCISLQGKGAALASHDYESSTKTLGDQTASSKLTIDYGSISLAEFKARLRMSFRVLIQKSHLLTVMDALKRALIGLQEGCSMIYEVNTGVLDGGKVSSFVAAGVDCFDMVLESVSGSKRLDDVKSYTGRLISALFSIILHLHGPHIFFHKITSTKINSDPDPGSVTLMCVEVLAKVAGKPSQFQIHSCHIGQSFDVPAAIFQDFLLLRSTQSSLLSSNSDPSLIAGSCSSVVDQQFSVNLFAACCRLLCAVLRHHTSESERCMGSLQRSVSVLLHCLETVDAGLTGRGCDFAWKLHEGIHCASFLRRVYEEIKQQKAVLGSYCSRLLSNYISIYSGNGPCKTGFRREIDETLRPGLYALMDACSPEALQHLHTNLGEGPCRSTLAALQHDYKLNFRYVGKV